MFISILVLIILIIINGIFSASELAFLSIDKFELSKEVSKKNKKAIKIQKIINEPSKFLSTIQIGITLAGFLASAFAADYFADYFLNIISIDFLSESTLKTLLVVLITIILSYFTLVFGELVPKKIALNNSLKIASLFVEIINVISIIFYPLIKILTWSTELICKIFKIKDKKDSITEEDIKKMIILGKEEGVVEEKEKEYILNIFQFNDIEVKNIMTKKEDTILININDNLKENIAKIKKYKYTRFPVYENDTNNIIGILNVKDLILEHSTTEQINLRKILRPFIKFNYNEKIDDVFRYMQQTKNNISIIYDNSNFIGIVTLEDAIEEIVGNIYDEFDTNN